MSDNENENGLVASWWAASTDAEHEQVTLYRKEGNTESLLDRFTVTRESVPTLEDFQLEVKKNFGGGEYVAVMRGSQGQFARRIKFAVAGLPKREAEPAPTTGQATGLAEIAALLTRQQEASESRMLAIVEKLTGTPAGDPMDRALDLMVKMQKLQAPARSSLEGLKEFAEFRAIMRDLAGEEDAPRSDGFADLLKAALPVLGEVAKSGADVAKVKAAVALRKAQAARPAPPPGPTLPPEVLAQLRQLLELAPVMPPEELAAMVADQLDNEQAQAVVDAIDGHDWLQELITHEPAAKLHAAWLQAFAAQLVELLTGEPEPDEADPIEPAATIGGDAGQRDQGNAANAATDGGTSAPGDEKPSRKSRRRPDHAGTEAERLSGRSARGA